MSNLREYKLPDSGITVTYRPISPTMITFDVTNSFPKPKPPVQPVTYGEGDVRLEANWSHPDYPAMLAEWEQFTELLTVNAILLRSLVKNLTDDEKAHIKELREDMATLGINLDKSDKLVWFKHIAMGSDSDLMAFVNHLRGESEPSEEVVEPIRANFQGDV